MFLNKLGIILNSEKLFQYNFCLSFCLNLIHSEKYNFNGDFDLLPLMFILSYYL